MDELELRLSAVETAFIEIGARLQLIDPEILDNTALSLRAQLRDAEDAPADDRAVIGGALELVIAARDRFVLMRASGGQVRIG